MWLSLQHWGDFLHSYVLTHTHTPATITFCWAGCLVLKNNNKTACAQTHRHIDGLESGGLHLEDSHIHQTKTKYKTCFGKQKKTHSPSVLPHFWLFLKGLKLFWKEMKARRSFTPLTRISYTASANKALILSDPSLSDLVRHFWGICRETFDKGSESQKFLLQPLPPPGQTKPFKSKQVDARVKNANMSSVFPISADLSCHEVWLYIGPIMTGWFRRLVWCN